MVRGVTGVIVGFESIDDDELTSMDKPASVADNGHVADVTRFSGSHAGQVLL